jgi:hypothetical protein
MPVNLATQETEIRRIEVRGQPSQKKKKKKHNVISKIPNTLKKG